MHPHETLTGNADMLIDLHALPLGSALKAALVSRDMRYLGQLLMVNEFYAQSMLVLGSAAQKELTGTLAALGYALPENMVAGKEAYKGEKWSMTETAVREFYGIDAHTPAPAPEQVKKRLPLAPKDPIAAMILATVPVAKTLSSEFLAEVLAAPAVQAAIAEGNARIERAKKDANWGTALAFLQIVKAHKPKI